MFTLGRNVIERLARFGYGARGIVYCLVGGLALLAAIGRGGRAGDSESAIRWVLAGPFGAVLVGIIAAGLAAFSLWRLVEGVTDADRRGRSLKGTTVRAAHILSAAIYGGLFALAGGCQFWLVDGPEFTNAFVYGGAYAGQIPGSTLYAPLRVLFTFVVPATMAAYLPTLLILGVPGPSLLPSRLGWFAPLFAVWTWLLAAVVWRAGLRRFTGAGG